MQALIRTADKWTTGIVFYPPSDPVKLRYPFFDIDEFELHDNPAALGQVLIHYMRSKIPCLVHNTGNGWHFIGTEAMPKGEYIEFMRPLVTKLKREPCPQTTLRAESNKYIDELWTYAVLGYSKEQEAKAELIMQAMQEKDWNTLHTYFKIVRYPLK